MIWNLISFPLTLTSSKQLSVSPPRRRPINPARKQHTLYCLCISSSHPTSSAPPKPYVSLKVCRLALIIVFLILWSTLCIPNNFLHPTRVPWSAVNQDTAMEGKGSILESFQRNRNKMWCSRAAHVRSTKLLSCYKLEVRGVQDCFHINCPVKVTCSINWWKPSGYHEIEL